MTSKRYSFPELIDIMAKLRAPDGCPWDREQTHASILSCLIEESYEFVDAVERNDLPNMREELGDLLLQVVFHAEMAREAGNFDVNDVVHVIAEKLVRRHPHVFANVAGVDSADKVAVQWDEIKKVEKGEAKEKSWGALGEIPKHLPSLLKALKISKRAVKAGFEWPDWTGVSAKVREELAEFEVEAVKTGDAADRDALEGELGDLLFSVVNLGRVFDIDPERALARTNVKFTARFHAMEAMATKAGKTFESHSLEEMEELWVRAKTIERNRS